jgi:hypothetical protein
MAVGVSVCAVGSAQGPVRCEFIPEEHTVHIQIKRYVGDAVRGNG